MRGAGHDCRPPALRRPRLDPLGDQALALEANDRALYGYGAGGKVDVGPGDTESLAETQPGGEHEPCKLRQVVALGELVGVEHGQPNDGAAVGGAFDGDKATGTMPAAQRVASVLTPWRS
jgi:hypothetical protein